MNGNDENSIEAIGGADGEYDAFAADYEWIYRDERLTGETTVAGMGPVLAGLPDGAAILDCACGTGVVAVALARHGWRVEGTDASAGMIARAQENAAAAGVDVPFGVCPWEQLPGRFDGRFDLVFCCGNAIGHCRDEEQMLRSLVGMRAALKPGGLLIVDSRNWEMLLAEKKRFTTWGSRARDGVRCTPVYVWTYPRREGEPILIEVVMVFERDGQAELRSYPIRYWPFRHADLLARLEAAGFSSIESDHETDDDRYRVTARRA